MYVVVPAIYSLARATYLPIVYKVVQGSSVVRIHRAKPRLHLH
jgi:hypothetical protein